MCFRRERRLRPRPPQPVTLYMYCAVSFDGTDRTYCYISDDPAIAKGMLVVVPAGRNNQPELALVMDVQYVSAANAPFPVEKTKHILHRCTARDKSWPAACKELMPYFVSLFQE